MFALFSVTFGSLFIAFGVAAVIGHVLLIDVLLRPTSVAPAGTADAVADASLQAQPAR